MSIDEIKLPPTPEELLADVIGKIETKYTEEKIPEVGELATLLMEAKRSTDAMIAFDAAFNEDYTFSWDNFLCSAFDASTASEMNSALRTLIHADNMLAKKKFAKEVLSLAADHDRSDSHRDSLKNFGKR
jgi:hypothetical protein